MKSASQSDPTATTVSMTIPASTLTITATTGGNRRKGKEKEITFQDISVTTSKHRTSASQLSTRDALLALLLTGKSLGIMVNNELDLIKETLAAIERWEVQTLSALLTLDSQQIAPLVSGYRDLMAHRGDCQVQSAGDRTTAGEIYPKAPTSKHPFPSTEGINSSFGNENETAGALKENALWDCVTVFSREVQRLKEHAAVLGIGGTGAGTSAASSSYLQLELCLSAIRWMDEARALLYFPSLSHPATIDERTEPQASALTANSSRVESNSIGSKLDSVDEKDIAIAEKIKKPQRKQKSDSQGPQQIVMDVATSEFDTIDSSTVLETPNLSTGWGDCCR